MFYPSGNTKYLKTTSYNHQPILIKSNTNINGRLKNSSIKGKSSKSVDKKQSWIASNYDKQILYLQTVSLKKKVNKLQTELEEKKTELVKTGLNIKKKEKMIEDLHKVNETDENKKENKRKGREITRTSIIQNNYKQLKLGFKKLEEENKKLKGELTVAAKKEKMTDIDELLSKMKRMKKKFINTSENNQNRKDEIDDLKEYKNKFFIQHKVIENLQEESKNYDISNFKLSDELEALKEKLAEKEELLKKQNIAKKKLEKANTALLKGKKASEKYNMSYNEYFEKIKKMEEELEETQKMYSSLESESNTKAMEITKLKEELKRPESPTALEYKGNKGGIDIRALEGDESKIKVLNEYIKEISQKTNIYEKHLKSKGVNIEQLLLNEGFEGVIS